MATKDLNSSQEHKLEVCHKNLQFFLKEKKWLSFNLAAQAWEAKFKLSSLSYNGLEKTKELVEFFFF